MTHLFGISIGAAAKGKYEEDIHMDYKINKIQMQDEFKVCPFCGYEDGFHSMFKKAGDITRWLFICPSCHAVFDIGYNVPA